jgi:lipopolysaccharide transport system permease protein
VMMVLVRKEVTVRYKNSYLGLLWSLLNPLASALVLNLVFGVILKFGTKNYLILLLSGMFPWQWFSNSINQAPFSFLSNVTLVKQIQFPRLLIPLVTVLSDGVHFVIALPVYVMFLYMYSLQPSFMWLYAVPLLLIISMFTIYGICLFVATVNMFFRDLGNLVLVLMNILFYATPIMYTVDDMPQKFKPLLIFNPVSPIFISWRNVLFLNTIDIYQIYFSIAYACALILIAFFAYHIFNKRFAEVM